MSSANGRALVCAKWQVAVAVLLMLGLRAGFRADAGESIASVEELKEQLNKMQSKNGREREAAEYSLGLVYYDRPLPKWHAAVRELLKTRNGNAEQLSDARSILCQYEDKDDIQILLAELRRILDDKEYSAGFGVARSVCLLGLKEHCDLLADWFKPTWDMVRAGDPREFRGSGTMGLVLLKLASEEVPSSGEITKQVRRDLLELMKNDREGDPQEWKHSWQLGELLFACNLSQALSEGQKPLDAVLRMVEDDNGYWANACARKMAIQMIDMEKSGFKNYWQDQDPAWKKRGILHVLVQYHVYSQSPNVFWLPYHGEHELDAIVQAYCARLRHFRWAVGIPRGSIVMTDGKAVTASLGGQRLEEEIGRAKAFLVARNEKWSEVRKRIVGKEVLRRDVVRYYDSYIQPAGRNFDERLEQLPIGGDL